MLKNATKTEEKTNTTVEEKTSIINEAKTTPTIKDQQDAYPLIQTLSDLREKYPELVEQLEAQAISKWQDKMSLMESGKIKKAIPRLFKKIVGSVTDAVEAKCSSQKVKGFLLGRDDPYGAGVLRTYQKLKGLDNLERPYVLPFSDPSTKKALESYILRSNGCDQARAAAAKIALSKCK